MAFRDVLLTYSWLSVVNNVVGWEVEGDVGS